MSKAARSPDPEPWPASEYRLQLYVAGPTPRSVAALRNLESICAQHLPGRHLIEVIDLMKHPHLARRDNILAVPTLVRSTPLPVSKIIGNLSNAERVLMALDLPFANLASLPPPSNGLHV